MLIAQGFCCEDHQALTFAMEPDREGPVVIHETSDNCGCGGPGDGTHLLRAMLDADLGEILGPGTVCFGHLCDGDAVEQALAAGVGSSCTVTLGGRNGGEPYHGDPLVHFPHCLSLHCLSLRLS
jgi:microcystin degradation protein MlrC